MKAKEGFILTTTLAIITILTIAGAIGLYIVTKETRLTVDTSDSIKALKAAESGIEIAIIKLKNRLITSFPYSFSGTIDNATYIVTLDVNGNSFIIDSEGKKNDAERRIVASVEKKGSTFFPFSINGKLKINRFHNKGRSRSWTDAQLGVKIISEELKRAFEESAFTVKVDPSGFDFPKASNINISPEKYCSDVELNKDKNLTLSDLKELLKNKSGNVFICGKNISIGGTGSENALDFDADLFIVAKENVTISSELKFTGNKQSDNSADNLSFIAGGQIIFNSNAGIDFSGSQEGYNILLYAQKGIESTSFNDLIKISGNQNTEYTSNVFIITPETVRTKGNLIFEPSTTKKDVNFLIWADKGIESEQGGFKITGNSGNTFGNNERNFSILVSNGNVSLNSWFFAGQEQRSGLSYYEIKYYCEEDTTIPSFYKNIYCQLKDMIDGRDSKTFKIKSWKIY
ncbi:pilus assembly PilX N-terminal domain-containing protein [Desulfurobacterium thermolithotrophum]|uniref:pilus assembly PilX N-terminal domain-containing protein n=1 Tax=Desulfurobacterium thermolithotrophum TaxID=64160 RepID=UPI0013D0669B|nr:pilus assembly PilX N-terminal domain-containing protein [Desulfurobacterium thermolithotrophum]